MAQRKPESRRKQYEILRGQLENERNSFIPTWRDSGDFILPRRPRFFVSDTNRGERRNQKIIDSTATLAARTLRSGMMSGITSPARPWFRLATPEPGTQELPSVKQWLHIVSTRMTTVFLKSNLYNVLPIVYGDLGVFATAAMMIEEDATDVIRCTPFPIGSYMLANNHKGQVDTFLRDFRMTVRQLVQRFGKYDEKTGAARWDNFSSHVKDLWDKSNYETWIDIAHVIRPNELFDRKMAMSKYKRFSSCYYERGSNGSASSASYMSGKDEDILLSEKGYDHFPILAPRWEVTGEDVYGTSCPAIDALGDIKALQTMQKRKAQAVEKMVNPPMQGPNALRSVKTSILPGDITYTDSKDGGLRPVHEVNPRVNELLMDIQDVRQVIKRAFYEDLFLMLASSDRREITAREIDERHEEKLLALGPVLEQLNQDLLDPLIDNTFEIMLRQGMVPPPPAELEGVELKVEYISVMAQAQKMVGISSVERFLQFAGQVAQFKPEVLDKIDAEQTLDIYGDMTSVPPGVIRSDDDVAAIRKQKAEAAKAQSMFQNLPAAASAAKDLSQTDLGGDTALSRMIAQQGAPVQ